MTTELRRKWLDQADPDLCKREDDLTMEERHELRRLCWENRILPEEREILVKGAGFVARETTSMP